MTHRGYKRIEQKFEKMNEEWEEKLKKKAGIPNVELLQDKVKKLEDEKEENKLRIKLMSGTIQHMHQVINDLSRKVESLEVANTRKQIIISGLEIDSTKKSDIICEIESFILQEINLVVKVDDAYALGANYVVSFQTQQEKFLVLQNKEQLKGLLNNKDKPFYINDYFPQITNEKKRRERDIIKWNKQRQAGDRANIEYEKGQFKVDGKTYTKAVKEPQPDEVLDLSIQEYDKIEAMKIEGPYRLQEQDSIFYAYTAAVTTHMEVQNFYLCVRLKHMKARHVICAYQIQHDEFHTACDGCDDQEPGATRPILYEMRNSAIENRAFYVARYCGSQKLGAKRHDCYLNAAKLVLERNPHNKYLKIDQKFQQKQQAAAEAIAYSKGKTATQNQGDKSKTRRYVKGRQNQRRSSKQHFNQSPWRNGCGGSGRGRGVTLHSPLTYSSRGTNKKRRMSADYPWRTSTQPEVNEMAIGEDWNSSAPGSWSDNRSQSDDGLNNDYSHG